MEVLTPPHLMSVLIVEDQPDIAESLKMFLEFCGGYELSVALDGEAGVNAALADPPDAVVCDIGLPKKDGFRVAEELVAGLPYTPLLIAVTGYAGDEVEERARKAGFQHFLVKPASPVQVNALLRNHRDRRPGVGCD